MAKKVLKQNGKVVSKIYKPTLKEKNQLLKERIEIKKRLMAYQQYLLKEKDQLLEKAQADIDKAIAYKEELEKAIAKAPGKISEIEASLSKLKSQMDANPVLAKIEKLKAQILKLEKEVKK